MRRMQNDTNLFMNGFSRRRCRRSDSCFAWLEQLAACSHWQLAQGGARGLACPGLHIFRPAGASVSGFAGSWESSIGCLIHLNIAAFQRFNARNIVSVILITGGLLFCVASSRADEIARQIIPFKPADKLVSTQEMQQIYDEVKTPFKYGVVLKGDGPEESVDCPSVFRYGKDWYMMYVAISNKVGYQTFLARSDDLVNWTKLGTILPFSGQGWDAWQADGGVALADYHWNGAHELETFDGKYWLSYIGGAKLGYETDPLSLGIASTREPAWAREWHRLRENPVLSPKQP